jgi:hypothetical protein
MTEILLMRDWNRVIAPASTIIEIVLAFHAKHLMRGAVQRTRGYVCASDLLNIEGELKDAKYPASPFPSVADFYPGPPFSQRMYSVPRFLVDVVRAAMAGAKSRTAPGSAALDGCAATDWNLIRSAVSLPRKLKMALAVAPAIHRFHLIELAARFVEVGDLPDQCTGHTRSLITRGIRKHIRCRGLEHVHLVLTARGAGFAPRRLLRHPFLFWE